MTALRLAVAAVAAASFASVGCPRVPDAPAAQPCVLLQDAADAETLARLRAESGRPLVLVGAGVWRCDCGERRIAGDTERRELAGDEESRRIAGDTEARTVDGDVEGRRLGGDEEERRIAGDTEARRVDGAAEERRIAGDTEERRVDGAIEDRVVAGHVEVPSCAPAASCSGYVVTTATAVRFYDGGAPVTAAGNCVPW
jgi:hypothetical protein